MDDNTRNSLAQDKVLILYVLNYLKKEITESDLFKFISPVDDMNYFYFKQILSDLVDSKLIETYTKEEFDENNPAIYKLTIERSILFGFNYRFITRVKKVKSRYYNKKRNSKYSWWKFYSYWIYSRKWACIYY